MSVNDSRLLFHVLLLGLPHVLTFPPPIFRHSCLPSLPSSLLHLIIFSLFYCAFASYCAFARYLTRIHKTAIAAKR